MPKNPFHFHLLLLIPFQSASYQWSLMIALYLMLMIFSTIILILPSNCLRDSCFANMVMKLLMPGKNQGSHVPSLCGALDLLRAALQETPTPTNPHNNLGRGGRHVGEHGARDRTEYC